MHAVPTEPDDALPTPTLPPEAVSAARRDLAALAAAYWDHGLEESPIGCTYLGLPRGQDRLDERGPAARARRERALDGLLRRVEAVPPDALVGEDRLTRQILVRSLSADLEALRRHAWEWDIDQLGGLHLVLQDLGTKHRLVTPADADAWLSRLAAIPQAIAEWIGDLRSGLASGRVAPRVAYERVLAQVRAFVATPGEAMPFLAPVARPPAGWSEADHARARARTLVAIESHVRPAYASFLRFLETEYAGKARSDVGVWAIPGGAEDYAYRVRLHTTTTLSPERIHQIGLEELEKNEREMLEIARAEGHTGDLRSFFDAIGKDSRFRLATREAVLERYRAVCARMDRKLPEAFGMLPPKPYQVIALEAWREKDAPAAYYQPPEPDGPRPGIFYANTHDPASWPTYDMEALCYHEAVPGHHLQISIAQTLPGLPEFRRHAGFTAYVEGWAHYTERLADELGMYSTPYDRLGMLAGQAWRAARLVVDTGMHALRWDRSKAVDVLRRIRSGPEADVGNEIDRYVMWPGQALAYKIGQRTFTELRERAKRRLGDRFRLPAFHDEVLRHGAVPLSLLEDLVRSWDGHGARTPSPAG